MLGVLLVFGVGSFGATWADDATCRFVKMETVPITFDGAQPMVEGKINGKSMVMRLGSGNPFSVLMAPVARAMKLPMATADAISQAGTNGSGSVYVADIESLSVGSINGSADQLAVLAPPTLPTSSFDADVGSDFLFQSDLEFNFPAREVYFFRPANCNTAFLGYWDSDASVVPFEGVSSTDPRPAFTVQVNGHDVLAIFSSGEEASRIDLTTAASLGVTPDSPGVTRIEQVDEGTRNHVDKWIAPFDTITIGSERLRHVKIVMTDFLGVLRHHTFLRDARLLDQPKLILGADFLKAHRVLVAVSQKRLYFSYVGGPIFTTTLSQPKTNAGAPAKGSD